ncbi:hypothetical protein HanPSC8_Chr08g0334191 [Helianthus annuus]|nr:hypothetical protein HanPSC8_Chr08g0334191 [Helianthus annuus]
MPCLGFGKSHFGFFCSRRFQISLDLPVPWSPATSECRFWSSVLQQNHPAIVNYGFLSLPIC